MSHKLVTWEYNEEELSNGMSFDVYNENGKRITEPYVTQEEARLISAAPKLLAALITAKWMLERDFIDHQKMDVINKCREAIKQAKGE